MRVAEFGATLDARRCHAGLDGGEFERQRRAGATQSRQRISFGTLHVDLDECGGSVPQNERIEGRHRHLYGGRPRLSFPARLAINRPAELLRAARTGRTVDLAAQRSHSYLPPPLYPLDDHSTIPSI